jgi:hypothetical protein
VKKTLIAALFVFASFTSFSRNNIVGFPFEKENNVTVKPTLLYVYDMFLMMDGCYHLYKLDSYIDGTGMSVQGWVLVNPSTYIGTTTLCLNESIWDSLC